MFSAFVAGATSFTGRAIAFQDAKVHGIDLRLQVRPKSKNRAALDDDPRIVEVALDDAQGLIEGMAGCNAVIQLIGTIRTRFAEDGDYEKVDFESTQKLLAAATRAKVPHFILLSSVGAGTGLGSYLGWKKKTEMLVKESGLGFTLVRAGAFAGDAHFSERKSLTNVKAFMNGLTETPFGAAFAVLKPMPIQELALIFLQLVRLGPQQKALRGTALFELAKAERQIHDDKQEGET